MRATDLRAFLRLTRAWSLSLIRERTTIFWMFVFPILFVVIFGFAFGRTGVGSYDIGVVVDSATPAGQALMQALARVEPFDVHVGPLDAELARLREGRNDAVIAVTPAPPASSAPAGEAALTIYYDPSRTVAQQIVLPILREVVYAVDRQLSGQPPVLRVQEQSVRTDSRTFMDFFLPGVIAFSIMQSGMFAAIPFVQLRVSRVLKRFGATPLARWPLLSSQIVTRLALAVAQTVVLLLTGWLLFDLHLGSNLPGAAAFVLLGGLVFLSMGFAVSGLARSEETVPALVQAVSFPMMFLAGVFFPIENFPDWLQAVARVLPLTFLADALRQTMVDGAALNPLWLNGLALLAWLAAGAALAARLFRWE